MASSSKDILPSVSNPASRNFIDQYVAKNGINFTNSLTAGSSYMATPSAQLRAGAPTSLTTDSVDTADEATEGAGESAAGDAVPELAIAQMAQKFGAGLNGIITGIANYNINADYINTLTTGHGIGLQEQAVNEATSRNAQNSLESIGGSLGAMFGGPVGMLAGRGLAHLFETPITGAVAYSSGGPFNPQTGGTQQSQSSTPESNVRSTSETPQANSTLSTNPFSVDTSPSTDNNSIEMGSVSNPSVNATYTSPAPSSDISNNLSSALATSTSPDGVESIGQII